MVFLLCLAVNRIGVAKDDDNNSPQEDLSQFVSLVFNSFLVSALMSDDFGFGRCTSFVDSLIRLARAESCK